MDKQEGYAALVTSRKVCHLCEGLTNPSDCSNGASVAKHIGPWTQWQGNLDPKLMIVGQDWGDTTSFEPYQGQDSDHNPSNMVLRELLYSIGIETDPPSRADKVHENVFLTNAILCLKKGGLGGPVRSIWFDNCGRHFLRPTIDLIQPRVLVSLGKYAFQSIGKLYDLPKMQFRDAVNQPEGFELSNGWRFFAMYHCSPRVLYSHRSKEQQKADWLRVKRVQ